MRVSEYAKLVALWTEYEMGQAHGLRPWGLQSARILTGQSLASQGHREIEARAGYPEVRAALQARYVWLIRGANAATAELDRWEAEFAADLLRSPVLLVPPQEPKCRAELSEEDARKAGVATAELERLLLGRRGDRWEVAA